MSQKSVEILFGFLQRAIIGRENGGAAGGTEEKVGTVQLRGIEGSQTHQDHADGLARELH